MVRVLHVAEKPSVAKELACLLSGPGGPRRRNGKSKYNPIFEFQGQLRGQLCQMAVTSVSGHLQAIDFDDTHRSWDSCRPESLFSAAIVRSVPESMHAIRDTLHAESRRAQWLVLWLDCDLEGENICFEVSNVCQETNPNLSIFRATFSALIPAQIRRACETLAPPKQLWSDAVEARTEIDLRIGACFTRFQSKLLRNKYQGLPRVISYGPCQFPTLGFVVERHFKIVNFVPEPFWELDCVYTVGEQQAKFHWKRGPLYDRYSAVVYFSLAMEFGGEAEVLSLVKKEKRKWRPLPLATIEFQKLASRKLGIGSHAAMQIAEDLYTKGFISYPRTETDQFPEGTEYTSLLENQTNSQQWGNFARDLLENDNFLMPRRGRSNDNAHPPIHPTKWVSPAQLGDNGKRRVYELICRHFIACCSKDAIGDETKVEIVIGTELFTTTGLVVRERNYLNVYVYENWGGASLPEFNEGDAFYPDSLMMRESTTSAPSYLAEDELIALMDKNGIGTDATIAQHIETILKREYAEKRDNKYFHPTPLGVALVSGYDAMGLDLSKPRLRADMERKIALVCRGDMTKQDFLTQTLTAMKETFMLVSRQGELLEAGVAEHFIIKDDQDFTVVQREFSKCGVCSGVMDLVVDRDGEHEWHKLFCVRCSKSLDLPRGKHKAHAASCPICNYQVVEVTSLKNKTYTVCPGCFKNPPRNQVEDDENGFASGFRCFQCSFECELAGNRGGLKDRAARLCQCNSLMYARYFNSSCFIGCSGYPSCKQRVNLPAFKSLEMSRETCNRCSRPGKQVFKAKMSFMSGNVSPQFQNRSNVIACLGGCDQTINQDLLESCR